MAPASLERALAQAKDEYLRDSVIQRFEYTYELSWKPLKRHLEQEEGVSQIESLSREQLYRVAREKGLIEDIEAWFAFHAARNNKPHAYNDTTAEEGYRIACRFAPASRRLLEELKRRADA